MFNCSTFVFVMCLQAVQYRKKITLEGAKDNAETKRLLAVLKRLHHDYKSSSLSLLSPEYKTISYS